MGNGMEVVGWEGWSLQAKACTWVGTAFPFLGRSSILFGPSTPCLCQHLRARAAAHKVCTGHPSHIPHHVRQRYQPHVKDHLLPSLLLHLEAAPAHAKDEVPELVLNQPFLEITAHQELHFLTQMISFCLRAGSLAFLNVTARIDAVLGQRTAVDSCLLGDFSSPFNQAGSS